MLYLINILTNNPAKVIKDLLAIKIIITILNKLDKEFCRNKIMRYQIITTLINIEANKINKIR